MKPSQNSLFKADTRVRSVAENGILGLVHTIITTAANGVVGKIHQRMPVILQKEYEEEWVNPDIVEPERLLPLLKQYPDKEMEAYPVSTAVNRPTIDTAELIKPLIN
jgi:putative SOS response-associated peptidase YedK